MQWVAIKCRSKEKLTLQLMIVFSDGNEFGHVGTWKTAEAIAQMYVNGRDIKYKIQTRKKNGLKHE